MSDISQWDTAAANNDDPSPDGAPEGMAPSAVNDTMREMMAAVARWYQDTDGSLDSGGTGNAYTLTTNNSHAALADQSIIVFRADRANTGAATLDVDSLGAKSIHKNGGDELFADEIRSGQIIVVIYDATDDDYKIVSYPASNHGALTSVNGEVTAGNDVVTVDDASGFFVDEAVIAILDDDSEHSSTITAIATNDITIADAVPSGRSIPDRGLFRSDVAGDSAMQRRAITKEIERFAAGDEDAPEFTAASAIGQGELKTTTGTVSLASTSTNAKVTRTLPGGEYGFFPETNADGSWGGTNSGYAGAVYGELNNIEGGTATTSRPDFQIQPPWNTSSSGTSFSTSQGARIFMQTSFDEGGSTMTVEAHQRFVQASPPYDLGNGEVGLFIEADVLPDKSIGGLYIAPDPIWANNGPTNIRPDWTNPKTGKKYKHVRRPALTRDDLEAGRCDMADYIAAQKEAPIEDVEVDFVFKNADMDFIPHSWASPPQGTIYLLDPVNTHDLLMLHEAGEDVADLIHKGYIKIGDPCERCGPPGVVPVSFKWKNTK